MTLYDHPDCPYAKKVRIVLAEKELSFDTVTVDLKAGEQQRPEFLRLNPFGKVPVLVDDGMVIYDSTTINEYLNDEYLNPLLLPEDSAARARVRLLEDYADRAFTLPAMAAEGELVKPVSDRDEARLDRARKVLLKGLALLDRELGGEDFLAGEFSLADIAFAPAVLQLEALGIKLDSGLVHVRAWAARLAERPSIGPVARLVA